MIRYLLLVLSLLVGSNSFAQPHATGVGKVITRMSHTHVSTLVDGDTSHIAGNFGQSNSSQANMTWAYGLYPVYALPTSPVNYTIVDPTIQIAVDFIKPTHTATIQAHDTNTLRWESTESDYWTSYGFPAWGWEQTFLRDYRDRVNDTVYFFSLCKGGVNIETFMAGGEIFPNIAPMIRFTINSTLAKGKIPKIDLIEWGQGESNQGDASYAVKLEAVINYVRGIYPPYTTNVPFILRKLSVTQTLFSSTVVNAQMDQVAIDLPNVYVIAPDAMSPPPSCYDEPGYGAGNKAHYDGPTNRRFWPELMKPLCLTYGLIP